MQSTTHLNLTMMIVKAMKMNADIYIQSDNVLYFVLLLSYIYDLW